MSEREHHLILRHLEGNQTSEEKQEFELWITTSAGNQELVDSYRKIWEASGDDASPEFDSKAAWNQFASAVQLEPETRQRSLWPVFKIAAAILILVVASAMVYVVFFNATRAELRSNAEPVHATLPDGSEVWLNDNSRLSYVSDSRGERLVELSGEAFFDVKKDSKHPFIITAGEGTVKVLGTSFNVNARAKDSISVYVVTGSVSLAMDHEVGLTAGQRGVVSNKNTSSIASIPDPNEIAWKTKRLVFAKDNLENVARRLRIYFKKDIRISNDSLAACRFTGSFDDPTLNEIFETLSFALDIEVATSNNGYVISGNGCNSN